MKAEHNIGEWGFRGKTKQALLKDLTEAFKSERLELKIKLSKDETEELSRLRKRIDKRWLLGKQNNPTKLEFKVGDEGQKIAEIRHILGGLVGGFLESLAGKTLLKLSTGAYFDYIIDSSNYPDLYTLTLKNMVSDFQVPSAN